MYSNAPWLRLGIWLSFLLGTVSSVNARDVFVILSGGVSPESDNYSQFVQARSMARYFLAHYPRRDVFLFFAAGNVEGEPAKILDVRLEKLMPDGIRSSTWFAGFLPGNQPAVRETIFREFREHILPAVHDGGTLFLFVGDHGDLESIGSQRQSVINLWGWKRDPLAVHGWRSDRTEKLGVAELRELIEQGLGKGKVVFCMTQCHSGGFQFLGIPHELTPERDWYQTAKPRGTAPEPRILPIAGFTATNEATVAAGCTPDPDPGRWEGYERYLPEFLLGTDLLTANEIGRPLNSFFAAHVAATLADRTTDKPYSTSEQYLERWAVLIENRLACEPRLTAKVKSAIYDYRCVVEGAALAVNDPDLAERQRLFGRFIKEMARQRPDLADVLLHGTSEQLTDASNASRTQNNAPRSASKLRVTDAILLIDQTLNPAWVAALKGNAIPEISENIREFELEYAKETDGKDYDGIFPKLNEVSEVFWHAGYGMPTTGDAEKAAELTRWLTRRLPTKVHWGQSSLDPTVRSAADDLAKYYGFPSDRIVHAVKLEDPSPSEVGKPATAARVLFYRRVLAAWQFLLAVGDQTALAHVKSLTELERTPLPIP